MKGFFYYFKKKIYLSNNNLEVSKDINHIMCYFFYLNLAKLVEKYIIIFFDLANVI